MLNKDIFNLLNLSNNNAIIVNIMEITYIIFEKILLGFSSIILILVLLLSVAYAILIERKVLASIQKRRGPNFVGFFGLLQPIADALKLIFKETIIPMASDKKIFIISPLIALSLSLLNWAIIPFNDKWTFADVSVSLLMFFALSSLTVYGVILSGWSSNSKYAFLGALRAAAQVIAYEVCIGLILVYILIQTGELNYSSIILQQCCIWNIIPSFIFGLLFFIACLAETNRPPFDLPEAEAELVSGYNVEYSAMAFGYFFLSEYVSIWTVCILNIIIFWGGYYFIFDYISLVFFIWKVILFLIVFVWVRGSLPRYRYDQLMRLGWKILLPNALGAVLIYGSVYYGFLNLNIF